MKEIARILYASIPVRCALVLLALPFLAYGSLTASEVVPGLGAVLLMYFPCTSLLLMFLAMGWLSLYCLKLLVFTVANPAKGMRCAGETLHLLWKSWLIRGMLGIIITPIVLLLAIASGAEGLNFIANCFFDGTITIGGVQFWEAVPYGRHAIPHEAQAILSRI